jgi:hypothetical protein
MDADSLRMVIASIRLPKGSGKREHAVSLAQACSPMHESALGRAGLILWRRGLVEELRPDEADVVLLRLKGCVTRQDEDGLTREVLETWEAYS